MLHNIIMRFCLWYIMKKPGIRSEYKTDKYVLKVFSRKFYDKEISPLLKMK